MEMPKGRRIALNGSAQQSLLKEVKLQTLRVIIKDSEHRISKFEVEAWSLCFRGFQSCVMATTATPLVFGERHELFANAPMAVLVRNPHCIDIYPAAKT